METYRHSGVISPLGIFTASTAGIAVAVVLGVIYSFGIVNIPVVQINFLLTFFFGILMGLAVGWGAKLGKIRNTFVAAAYGFIVGIVGLYFAWGTDCLIRLVIPIAQPADYLKAYSPNVVMEYIRLLYHHGVWALKDGKNVTGPILAAVWASEALIIVSLSTFFAWKGIANRPFCENCKRWAIDWPDIRNLSFRGANEAVPQLLSGDLAALMKFNRAQEEADYLQLELKHCPTCEDCNLLTITQAKESVDREGKLSIAKTPLVRNMLIAAEFVPVVKNAGLEPAAPETADDDSPGEEQA